MSTPWVPSADCARDRIYSCRSTKSHTRKDRYSLHLVSVTVLTAVIAGLLVRWLIIPEQRRSLVPLPNRHLVYAQARPIRLRGPFIALTALWSALLITEIATNPAASNTLLYVYLLALAASAVNLTTIHLQWRLAGAALGHLAHTAGR